MPGLGYKSLGAIPTIVVCPNLHLMLEHRVESGYRTISLQNLVAMEAKKDWFTPYEQQFNF